MHEKRQRMDSAMRQFIRYLRVRPTNHSKEVVETKGADASPCSREYMREWDKKIASMVWSLEHWWDNLEGVSPSTQLDSLRALLYSFDPSECKNTSTDGSRSLAGDPEHHEVHNIGVQSSGLRGPPQGASAIVDSELCASLPILTARALATAARIDAEYAEANRVFRKGFSTNDSIPLEKRAKFCTWHRKHGPPNSTGTVKDGAAFRFLGGSFLQILHDWDLLKRIDSVRVSGDVPRAACETTKFHRVYWKAFQRVCGQPFSELTPEQQATALKKFLRQKFSTDPSGRAMLPPKGRRPKKLSWAGFWLNDEEVIGISESVIAAYQMHCKDAAFHRPSEHGQTQ